MKGTRKYGPRCFQDHSAGQQTNRVNRKATGDAGNMRQELAAKIVLDVAIWCELAGNVAAKLFPSDDAISTLHAAPTTLDLVDASVGSLDSKVFAFTSWASEALCLLFRASFFGHRVHLTYSVGSVG